MKSSYFFIYSKYCCIYFGHIFIYFWILFYLLCFLLNINPIEALTFLIPLISPYFYDLSGILLQFQFCLYFPFSFVFVLSLFLFIFLMLLLLLLLHLFDKHHVQHARLSGAGAGAEGKLASQRALATKLKMIWNQQRQPEKQGTLASRGGDSVDHVDQGPQVVENGAKRPSLCHVPRRSQRREMVVSKYKWKQLKGTDFDTMYTQNRI